MDRMQRALARADETERIELRGAALDAVGPMLRSTFGDAPVVLIADERTDAVAGGAVRESIAAANLTLAAPPHVFPGTPTLYADHGNVDVVRALLASHPDAAVCSIGSGTLNDITKLAAGGLGRRYVHVCTAASMDGYSAFGASIMLDGFKSTQACPAPVGVVADVDVMAAAPARLTASGYGDLIEKIPAGADWILADALGVEPIDEHAWGLAQDTLADALARPDLVATGDAAAIERLAQSHLLSGLAMQAARSSRPASGAGHQFSHLWEMEGHGLDHEPPLSHGFKVAVGTVASLAIWRETLRIDPVSIDVERIVAAAPSAADVADLVARSLPPAVAEASMAGALAKHVDGDALRRRLERIRDVWPTLVERVRPQLVSPEHAQWMLRTAGAPWHPALIGIDAERFRATHVAARLIRARYTVLDMLVELGRLDAVVARLFAPDGFWSVYAIDAGTTPDAEGRP